MSQLNELIDALDHHAPPSYYACQNLLSYLTNQSTNQSINRPDLIVKAARVLVTHYPKMLGDKVYDLHEKLAHAALLCGDQIIASSAIDRLIDRFTESSIRVQRLIALRMESINQLDEAQSIYDAILANDPTQVACHKRSIAISFARNRIDQAINQLTRYTKAFSSDETGWSALAQAYINQQQYELAAFCYEELILIAPENYAYHLALADCLFSNQSTTQSIDQARAHYAQSIELKPENNLRALYGIIACISAKPSASQHSLYAWAMAKLTNHYRAFAPHMLEAVLASLNVDQSTNQSIDQTADDETNSKQSGLRSRITAQ